MDILTLIIIIVLIGIGNIGLLLWMKFGTTSDTSVNINKSILKFQTSIDKTEKMIYDQLKRNREEINKISKDNREELSKSLVEFEEKFGKNIKDVRETINNQLKARHLLHSQRRDISSSVRG